MVEPYTPEQLQVVLKNDERLAATFAIANKEFQEAVNLCNKTTFYFKAMLHASAGPVIVKPEHMAQVTESSLVKIKKVGLDLVATVEEPEPAPTSNLKPVEGQVIEPTVEGQIVPDGAQDSQPVTQ